MTEPVWTSLSGVLLVDDLLVAEMDGHTELHVDGLMQGLGGELLPIGLYYSFTDTGEIAHWKALFQPGTLLVAKDEVLDVIGSSLRMIGSDLRPYEGDADALRRDFERQRARRSRTVEEPQTEAVDSVVGQVTECRILPTKNTGPMAIIKIEAPGEKVEAILFPETFREHRELIVDLGQIELYGTWQEAGENSQEATSFVVQEVRRGKMSHDFAANHGT